MTSYADLNLGNLPSDVIRKLITFELNSIDDVKLITPRWNILALEYLADRNRFPVIRKCKFNWHRDEQITVTIRLPAVYNKFFGVQNIPHLLDSSNCSASDNQYVFNIDKGQLMKGEGNDIDFLRRVFDRCSSVALLQVNLNLHGGGMYTKSITSVIGPLKINELRLEGLYCDSKAVLINKNCKRAIDVFYEEIISFVKENSVRLLHFSNFHVKLVKESFNFFIIASFFVPTIKFSGDQYAGENIWQDTTNWLNEIGNITERTKITATLAKPAQHKWIRDTCITIERKEIK